MTRTTVISALVATGVLMLAAESGAQQLVFSTTAPGGIESPFPSVGHSEARIAAAPQTRASSANLPQVPLCDLSRQCVDVECFLAPANPQ